MHVDSERAKQAIRKFFRAVLRSRADAYAFGFADRYHERSYETDPEMAGQVERLSRIEDLAGHYSYFRIEGRGLAHLKIQLARITKRLEEYLPKERMNGRLVLDAGDSDGLILTACGLSDRGVGLNLLDVCLQNSRAKGLKAVKADVEEMPFRDGAFEVVFCFEAVEHLENPILGIRELARSARSRVFMTIPYVERTRVHEDNDTRSSAEPAPEPERHVFEFSPPDFRKILSHTDLQIVRYEKIEIFPPIRNPWHRFFLKTFYFPNFFPALQFYELAPRAALSRRDPWTCRKGCPRGEES